MKTAMQHLNHAINSDYDNDDWTQSDLWVTDAVIAMKAYARQVAEAIKNEAFAITRKHDILDIDTSKFIK